MVATTIPGPAGTPLLGSLRDLRADTLAYYLRARRDFGDVVRFSAGPPGLRVSFYALFSAEGVKRMLATEADNFRKDHSFYDEVRQLIGNGLLTSQDEEYVRQRRLIQPLFTHKRVAEYAPPIVEEADGAARRWVADGVIDASKAMTQLTLRIVGRVLFGADVDAALSTIRDQLPVASASVVRRGFAPVRIPRGWPTPDNRRVAAAQRQIYRICDSIIDARDAADDSTDLLGLLLAARTEDGDRLSASEIRDQVLVFLLAGHETTATSLSFALHLLAKHPELQERARAEVDDVLGGGVPTAADVDRLEFLTRVVKETMRLYPAAPIVGRRCVDGMTVDGHRIPADASVLVSAWVTHRHPGYWSRPSEVDPDRFLPDQEKARPRYAYFPFGGGRRACIGQYFAMLESVLALAVFLRRFSVEAIDTDVPLTSGVTLRAAGPVRCRLTAR
ncbi:MAG TPA: cytochrome P450 [Stackebrandtia sp.]|uniref:cytochrome P450 n=1 Tax=Stackebrandtia sp. TaxID=2023065 RepID=UPI002D7310EF|nr:cytochrome P450 [Stackebrandtia sp.]HZE41010.1 cytochrome P450 [Stackebrandtia sp.]